MSLPKRNSADGRCYWMKPEVQEELQPLFDQCIQDAIDGRITRLDSLWPPVVVSSEGAPFEVHALVRKWTEAQQAETLDAEKAIAFSENLRRQSRWGEIDYYLLGLLEQELQEKYFVVTGREDDHRWSREYSLKPGIRAEEVPEPLLRFACYVAVSYKVYGMDFEYLDCLPYEGKEYLVLMPVDEPSTEIVILEVEPVDEENENYLAVEDEATLDAVYGLFKEKYKDILTFEEE